MKKTILAALAMVFLLGACSKEGVYTPKKKIVAVYYQASENEPKSLLEDYAWDGNKLKCRLFRGSVLSPYIDDFETVPTYDGKRIVRADENISGDYVEYQYDGKFLTGLVYHSGEEIAEATVEHVDGKISRVALLDGMGSKNCINRFMGFVLSQQESMAVGKYLPENSKYLAQRDCDMVFTWDGDNVSGVTTSVYEDGEPMLAYKSTFGHDSKLNPFAVNWADFASQNTVFETVVDGIVLNMSENNITRIDHEYLIYLYDDFISTQETEMISYEYDGKYPVRSVRTDADGEVMGIRHYEYLN